jgi:hypothetical protein
VEQGQQGDRNAEGLGAAGGGGEWARREARKCHDHSSGNRRKFNATRITKLRQGRVV